MNTTITQTSVTLEQVQYVANEFRHLGVVAGGCVTDLLLGHTVKDIDLFVPNHRHEILGLILGTLENDHDIDIVRPSASRYATERDNHVTQLQFPTPWGPVPLEIISDSDIFFRTSGENVPPRDDLSVEWTREFGARLVRGFDITLKMGYIDPFTLEPVVTEAMQHSMDTKMMILGETTLCLPTVRFREVTIVRLLDSARKYGFTVHPAYEEAMAMFGETVSFVHRELVPSTYFYRMSGLGYEMFDNAAMAQASDQTMDKIHHVRTSFSDLILHDTACKVLTGHPLEHPSNLESLKLYVRRADITRIFTQTLYLNFARVLEAFFETSFMRRVLSLLTAVHPEFASFPSDRFYTEDTNSVDRIAVEYGEKLVFAQPSEDARGAYEEALLQAGAPEPWVSRVMLVPTREAMLAADPLLRAIVSQIDTIEEVEQIIDVTRMCHRLASNSHLEGSLVGNFSSFEKATDLVVPATFSRVTPIREALAINPSNETLSPLDDELNDWMPF